MLQANDMRWYLSSVSNNNSVYFTSWTSSATRPSGCSARHRQTRSWPYPTTWTIPRRFWWPIGCVSVRFWTFCCLWRRSRRVRELQPLSIPRPRPSRPGRRHRHGWRICQPWGICLWIEREKVSACNFKILFQERTHFIFSKMHPYRALIECKM